jgi:hypothetical protein
MKNLWMLITAMLSSDLFSQNLIVQAAMINPPVQLQQRQRSNPVMASNVQGNRVSARNVSNDIQVQNFNPAININEFDLSLDNAGNAFEQVASFSPPQLPQIQLASGNADFSLEVNLPKVNFKPVKLGTSISSSSSSSHHRAFGLKKKLCRINRHLEGKFQVTKKLRFKVDKCFKW